VAFDPPGPKDPQLALRAAVFLGSCLSEGNDHLSPQGLLDAMYYVVQTGWPFETALEYTTQCFADRTDGCAAVEDCFAAHAVFNEGECNTTCLPGNVAQICAGTHSLFLECDRLGMQCTPRGCSPYPVLEPCDPVTFEQCQDGTPYHCSVDYPYSRRGAPCSEIGMECSVIQVGSEPWSVCKGTGAACESLSTSYNSISFGAADVACQGTEARACVNGAEHVYDCGSLGDGFACQGTGTYAFCGLSNDCNPGGTFQTTCEGEQIVVCNAGRVDRIDCKALGFDGCDMGTGLCFGGSKR
jgi:hypothetical protein